MVEALGAETRPGLESGEQVVRNLVAIVLLLVTGAVHAAWERQGMTPSGAVYRMAVPETWRAGDDLVVFQHGLSFELDTSPSLGPLLQLQLAQGYAVVASGYSQAGWAAFASQQDNRELVERFRTEVGEPGRILTYGGSLGGYIALQMAEDPQLEVAGALSMCPAAAGYRTWDRGLDLRLVYDALCDDVSGGRLPNASDHPWLVRASDISPLGLQALVVRINRCIGVNQPDWLRSSAQRNRLNALKQVFGISDDDFLLLNLGYATLGLSDLVRDPGKLDGRVGLGNAWVDYGDDELNARVRRVHADPFAALDFRLRSGLRGDGEAKVISLHTSRDELVVPEHQDWLRRTLPAARLSSALVAESSPSHCQFNEAEAVSAWESLRLWIDHGEQPDALELQSRCLALSDAGLAEGPCRIDPELVPQPFDDAVHPRNLPLAELDARFSGNWYDPERSGEGWLIEILSADTALVYGFTYPAQGEAGDQRWLLGTGRISGNGIAVDEVYSMRGGGFGVDHDPDLAQFVPWGRIDLVFDACGSGRLRFQGPTGYGSGERELVQILHLGDQSCSATAPDAGGAGAYSGSWYDPESPGQGIVVNSRADGVATLVWFSFSPADGLPIWLYAEGRIDDGQMRFAGVIRPRGSVFAPFDPEALDRTPWGQLELDFAGCDQAELRYAGVDTDYGSGQQQLVRLTRPIGLGDCRR